MPIGNICNGISFRHDDSVLRSFSGAVCIVFIDNESNLDKMRESNLLEDSKPLENHTKRSNGMDFGFEIIMDFAMSIDNLDLANLVGEVKDEIGELQIFWTFRKLYTKRSNSMFSGFENMMDFAMDIDKLNMANLAGKVMDKIMEYQIFLSKVFRR